MPKLISATYHANIEVAEFICDDGRHLFRHGGTLPWRINNPGDLTALIVGGVPAPKNAKGYVGFAKTKSGRTFLIFPNEQAARDELKANLQRMHGAKTIPEVVPGYAPKHENNTQKYINDLLKITGISAEKKIKDCSNAELEKIMDGISEIEGYHAKKETRKETWAVVSTINATNGSLPLPEVEVILQKAGKEERVKSDSTGRLPPVIHPADKTPVHVKVVDSKTKQAVKIGTIQGGVGKDFNLLAKFRKWRGVAGSEKINSAGSRAKNSTHYVVQPGDSLGKIARLHQTNVTAIKGANNLSSDKIYPGEVLLVNGSGEEESSDAQTAPAIALSKTVTANTAPVLKKQSRRVVPPPTSSIPPNGEPSVPERSKEGAGKVLALISPLPGRAPWMPIAIAEAKLRRGKDEKSIEKDMNYHTAIGDGAKSMSDSAWCAAFANWCLSKANYPIENPGYADRKATLGRAHGFYEMDEQLKVRNPLYAELEGPIYGAIAVVHHIKSKHGSHVGFVYAKSGSKYLILLGGNQGDQINFSNFRIEAVEPHEERQKNGVMKKIKGRPKYLKFFVPISYYEQAKKDLLDPGVEEMNVVKLNKEMGIEGVKIDGENSPKIT